MTALAAVRPRRAEVTAKSPARQQTDLALGYLLLVAVTCGMAMVGLGALARPFYMLAGAGFAWFTMRRSPWLYLSATLWFWLVTAFVRRFIDWRTGFNATDIILATPNLMTLFMLKDILTAPGLLSKRELRPGLAVAAAVSYGLCVSFFRGDVVPGAVAAADWLSPLFYFFYIVAHSKQIGWLEPHVRRFLLLSMTVMIPYCFVQYFYLPNWDAYWMIASNMVVLGQPFPMSFRVFGTTNNPTFLANWAGVCILLAPHLRSKIMTALVPFVIFVLLLTLVRAVYVSLALTLVVSVVLGRGQALKPMLMAAVVLATLFASSAMVNPIVSDQITKRIESMQKLDGDDSAQARKLLYQQMPELINDHPLGIGIGALGRGATVAGGEGFVNVNSTLLASYLALGWIAGTVYIGGLLLATGQAFAAAWRYRSSLILAFACAALSCLAMFPFGTVSNFTAALLWLWLGCATALSIRYRIASRRNGLNASLNHDFISEPAYARQMVSP